jgi:DNA-binding PadR family transcriptional regulator
MTKRDIDHDTDIDRQLPVPPAVLHILIALGEGEKHGYAVMQEVAERTHGKVRMSPGTLYGSIRKMLDEGLIEEFFHRSAAAGTDDARRRYYRVTKFGRAVAAAEAERLTALLHHARLNGLVPRKG